jgi:hypothetical protein
MSLNATLAGSARRIRAANLRLPVEQRINVAEEWRALLHRIDGKPDGRACQLVREWTLEVEQRLSLRLLNSPLTNEDDK